MESISIDESKYSIESRLLKANYSTRKLFKQFHERMSIISNKLNVDLIARTHVEGLSYFVTDKNAFIFLNFRGDYFALKFYTGKEKIPGLMKANWVFSGDECGSETVRVNNNQTLDRVLFFAEKSCVIAIKNFIKISRVNTVISEEHQHTVSTFEKQKTYNAPKTMKLDSAFKIINYAVSFTKWRWEHYDQSWKDIDVIFIEKGYEQQGFQLLKMKPLLERNGILSIDRIGSILDSYSERRSYNREYAGSLGSEFYSGLRSGENGPEGVEFESTVRLFLEQNLGSPGRTFWQLLFRLLRACSFLKKNYSSSFAEFIKAKYKAYAGIPEISDAEFLNLTVSAWTEFLMRTKPWNELMGIGPNVFDFIMGDIKEAKFAKDSYKFDSANQHFLTVTGISSLIKPFNRENTITFLNKLELPFSLREINKGIYTYCSKTESHNYGFCRNRLKCRECRVNEICEKHIIY